MANGLFGVAGAEQLIRDEQLARAKEMAGMRPDQAKYIQDYMLGQQLAGGINQLFGAEDPRITQARAFEEKMGSVDLTSPSGLYEAAQVFQSMGDYQRALEFIKAAQTLEAKGTGGRSYNLEHYRDPETGLEWQRDPRNPGVYYDMQGNQVILPKGLKGVKVGTGSEEGSVISKADAKQLGDLIREKGISTEFSATLKDVIADRAKKTGKSPSVVLEDMIQSGEIQKNPATGEWYNPFTWFSDPYTYNPQSPGQGPVPVPDKKSEWLNRRPTPVGP